MQPREYQKENQIPVGRFKPGIKLSSYNIHVDYLPILSTIFHYIYFSFSLSPSLSHNCSQYLSHTPTFITQFPSIISPLPPKILKYQNSFDRFQRNTGISLRLIANPPKLRNTIEFSISFQSDLQFLPTLKQQSLITHD